MRPVLLVPETRGPRHDHDSSLHLALPQLLLHFHVQPLLTENIQRFALQHAGTVRYLPTGTGTYLPYLGRQVP